MINDFNDFCTWMYVVTDDIWLKIALFLSVLDLTQSVQIVNCWQWR
jgi:hypothetical protein